MREVATSLIFSKAMDLSSSLVRAFSEHPLGLCGQHDPAQVVSRVEALEQRLSILTFGVVLDTSPLSLERWSVLVAMHDNWLLVPPRAAYQSSQQVLAEMQKARISGPQYIARVWWQICRGIQGRYKGSWRDLLKANDDDVHALQSYLQKSPATFPVLSGPVISARWLDLVHRLAGVALNGWETLTVTLPSSQRKTARLFGITVEQAHPLLSSALQIWETSCRQQPEETCGLANCPRRK